VTILLWTKLFGRGDFIHDGTETFYFDTNANVEGMFERCPPPMNRCRMTNNQSLIQQSEALIFHSQDVAGINWPEFRSTHQRWIFFNVESPVHTVNVDIFKNLAHLLHFNWTLTYRYNIISADVLT
jgi:alpha-1,3-fucosyltransferase